MCPKRPPPEVIPILLKRKGLREEWFVRKQTADEIRGLGDDTTQNPGELRAIGRKIAYLGTS